jgi:hypothetical protein
MRSRKQKRTRRGTALLASFVVMSLLAVMAVTYIDRSTQTMRESVRTTQEIQTTHLCESGVQVVLRDLWRPFKVAQHFEDLDPELTGASPTAPRNAMSGSLAGVGRFAAAVISFEQIDAFSRLVRVRAVGWIDSDNDGVLDAGEPRKIVDVNSTFELRRSQVFDYTYFVNNYGWMYGFGESDLIVNGDMRANGNFDFQGGSPTINGSVYASNNDKLDPKAPGLINSAPVKWTNSTYTTQYNDTTAGQTRWRQPYDPVKHGAIGSAEFEKWRDLVYQDTASIQGNNPFGSVLGDSTGMASWTRTSAGQTPVKSLVDSSPTEEVIMPDLTNLSYYQSLSTTYTDPKATYADGTANPYAGQGAWIDVWNSSTNTYQRVTTNGNYSGSLVLVGTDTKPIKIHGPVTISQDVVIKGTVQGQGTMYAGRNIHIVGSVKYKNPPNFKGTNAQTIENAAEKADFLGMAARASMIMGNPTTFGTNPLQYMTPPFTKGRYDENGNYIAAYNAMDTDSTGRKKYQSTISDSTMNSIAEGVNQIDAVMYTNFVGGGNVGTGGGGVTINGTIICKDESIVVYSLPLRLNYDTRIRERRATRNPLIDLQLPRSPAMLRSTWQDHGFFRSSSASTATASAKGKATNGGMNGNGNFGL